MELVIERDELDGDPVVVVRGEVDVATANQLRDAVAEAIGDGGGRLLLDLEGVDFIDSVGLGMIIAGLKRARSRGGSLELIATGRAVLRALEITGVNAILPVHPGRDAARQ